MKLIVSSPPHWHGKSSVTKIHRHFIIALMPVVVFAIYSYGMEAARVMALSITTAIISDFLIRRLFKKEETMMDGHAIFIGLLYALLLPPTVPFWLVIVGAFLSIIIGKEIFGGLGSSPLHPALVGWAIVHISWPTYLKFNMVMAKYNLTFDYHYPLTALKKGGSEVISHFGYLDLFLGKQVGGLGATAIFLLLIGGIYLLIRRFISWEIPCAFTLGIVLMATIFWLGNSSAYANPLFHLLTGNVVLGMFFLATDYASSPFSRWGKIIFGLGCGFLTIILRTWSYYPDGVIFAILLMNLFTPLLDKIKEKPKSLVVLNMERG